MPTFLVVPELDASALKVCETEEEANTQASLLSKKLGRPMFVYKVGAGVVQQVASSDDD